MTVETAVYINTLNGSNPSPTDLKSEGDDHIRLVKTVLQNTFPNITAQVTATAAGLNAASLVASSGTFPNVPLSGVLNISAAGNILTTVSGAVDAQVAAVVTSVGEVAMGINNSGSTNSVGAPAGTTYFANSVGQSTVWTVAGTMWLQLDPVGRLSGKGLHNNATAPTGTTNQYIASGTYTPTLTNVQNFSAITALTSQWMRVGNVVTVSGSFNAIAAASVTVVMGISLPIPSTLGTTGALSGAMPSWNGSTSPGGVTGYIRGDTTNNRANGVVLNDGFNGAGTWGFHFTYVVL